MLRSYLSMKHAQKFLRRQDAFPIGLFNLEQSSSRWPARWTTNPCQHWPPSIFLPPCPRSILGRSRT